MGRTHFAVSASRHRRLLLAAGVLVLTLGVAGYRGLGGVAAPDGSSTVAMLLFGQPDPQAIMASGRHGLGGQPVRLVVSRLSRCRYALAGGGRTETIDFTRITEIRHVVMDDPAAALARTFGQSSTVPVTAKRAVVIVSGRQDALCDGPNCTDRRAFGLASPDRIADARTAAASLRRTLCPGDSTPTADRAGNGQPAPNP